MFTNIPRPVKLYAEMPQVRLVQKMANLPTVTAPKEFKIREDFRETFLWRDVTISKYVNAKR